MRRIGLLGFGLSVLASAFMIFTPPANAQTAELTTEKAVAAFDTQRLNSLTAGIVSNELDIFHAYLNQRAFYQPIFPPMPDDLNQPAGLRVFDPAGFPAAFIKKLIPFECAPAVTAYRVVIREMTSSNGRRYRAIFNSAGEPLSWGWAAQTYDPLAFLKLQYPQLLTDWQALADDLRSPQAKLLQETYEPKRFVMALDLLPKDSLVDYVWAQSLNAENMAQGDTRGMQTMQMAESESTSDFEFIGIDQTNSALLLTVVYPEEFTNRISVVACTDLLQTNWVWLTTTNPPAYTTQMVVQASGASTNRMFAAYNEEADSDGDGVADGREFYLDKTSVTNPNDPPNIKGMVDYLTYSGGQTGNIYVVAVTASNSWSTNLCIILSTTGAYQFVKLPTNTYWIRAFRDTDGSKSPNTYLEAYGFASNCPITVNGQVTNVNVTLIDADTDGDGLGDWWEYDKFGDITFYNGNDDGDVDHLKNLFEYYAGTDPNTPYFTDNDGDWISDDWETYYGLDKDVWADGLLDPDGDGYTNVEEYQVEPFGTDPTNALDHPSYRVILPGFRQNSFAPYMAGTWVTNRLDFTNNYFGQSSTNIYVYEHGIANMFREIPYGSNGGTHPEPWLPGDLEANVGMIAPFSSDIDIIYAGMYDYPGRVFYGSGICGTNKAFAVTWLKVHPAGKFGIEAWNSFQCVWIDRSDVKLGDFDLEYNYETMSWDWWDCYDEGMGSAMIGFGSSTTNGLEWPGSSYGQVQDNDEFALASHRLNSATNGQYVFHFRDGTPYRFLFNDNLVSNVGWQLGAGWSFYGPTSPASAGDPDHSFLSGTNIIGYKATGAYETNIITPRYATTPAIICTNATNVYLHFRRWLNVTAGDVAKIEISTNNTTWSQVWSNAGTDINDYGWYPAMYNISTVAAGSTNVRLRWAMGPTDGVQVGDEGGWNLDEVRVLSFK